MVLDKVKLLLNIKTTTQDELLQLLIDMTEQHLLMYAGLEELPENLEFILVESTIIRFNQLGSEGLSSKSLAEFSVKYDTLDFKKYDKLLGVNQEAAQKGSVKFL